MGFLSKLAQGTKILNRISNSVSNVKELLDNAEYKENSIENYFFAAWVCRVGIIDNIEKLKFPMTAKISVNIKGHNTIMTLAEALAMTVGKLCFIAADIGGEVEDAISDILDKGKLFYDIDRAIPTKKKTMFQI